MTEPMNDAVARMMEAGDALARYVRGVPVIDPMREAILESWRQARQLAVDATHGQPPLALDLDALEQHALRSIRETYDIPPEDEAAHFWTQKGIEGMRLAVARAQRARTDQ